MPIQTPRSRKKIEYGDFQTPPALAREVCRLLMRLEVSAASVLEPTCGRGSLLEAAAEQFPEARHLAGLDVNPDYVQWTQHQMQRFSTGREIVVAAEDFFVTNWSAYLESLPDPLLLIGNPPWVTNSTLGSLASRNLPEKRNSKGVRGIEALTGKSNFDISEWMLLQMVQWMCGREAVLAMLCKTAVARKVLQKGWESHENWSEAAVFRIDAQQHFNAAVDACLLVIRSCKSRVDKPAEAGVFPSLSAMQAEKTIGLRNELLLADVSAYEKLRRLVGRSPLSWRSGVKHDCSKVLELRREGAAFRNGLDELVSLEPDYVFPMLKSSHIASGRIDADRWMIVTQRSVGEDTSTIADRAPLTWDYLSRHAERLSRRASSIYRGRPAFSVFGVGDYTFAPWKVAVSGLYKTLRFVVVGPVDDKPVVLDDTCYFLACRDEVEAQQLAGMLNSPLAHEFFEAFIFRDAKRPVTTELLHRLDLARLACETHCEWHPRSITVAPDQRMDLQMRLFQ